MSRNLPTYKIIRGNSDTRSHAFVYKDGEDYLPYDLDANYTDIKMDIRDKPFLKGRLIASLSLGNGLSIEGEDDNILKVELSSEQSLGFHKDKNRPYFYDIFFFGAGGKVITYLRGEYDVIANITDIETE